MKPYIVYLNKTYDVWMRDAHKWAEDNNVEYEEIISEVAFWVYIEKGLLIGKPVIFVKDIITLH